MLAEPKGLCWGARDTAAARRPRGGIKVARRFRPLNALPAAGDAQALLHRTPRASARMKTEAKVQLAMAVVGIPVMMLVVWNPSGTTKWPNPFREALDSFSKGGR